jgi:DNA-binding PadR family transcriptional regulator
VKGGMEKMDDKIKRVYIPMTETGFYILFCLQEEMHGYNIIQKVKEMTGGDVIIGAGTMYGSLSKMEKDGLIGFVREEDKRKTYITTGLGTEVLNIELKRIERLYKNSKGECKNEE